MEKENSFIKWWRKMEESVYIASTKAPKMWGIFWNLIIFGTLIIAIGTMFIEYQKTRAIPFEVEGSCNTGFIGIDFKTEFDNQPYSILDRIYDGSNPQDFRLVKHTRYFMEYLPKELNLKNIDGLNCNFKVKGAIPNNILQRIR